MSDKLNQNVHSFNIHDESAIIRGEGESGIKGKWDAIFHQEDLDDESVRNPDRLRGGGRNVMDMTDENRTIDPEYLELQHEYQSRERSDKRSFQDWLTDQPQHDEFREKRRDWAIKINLDKLEHGYESPVYEKFADLMKIWSKPDTKVIFQFGERKEDDNLVFEGKAEYINDAKRPRNVRVAIKREDFNQLIKENGRDLEIRRPRDEGDRNSVMFVLEHVRFHQSGFKGKEFEIGFPNIKLKSDIKRASEKLTESEFEESKKFLQVWKNKDVKGVGIRFKDNKLDRIFLQKRDGTQISISAVELRVFLPQIWRRDVGGKEGISVLGAEGQIVITSNSSEEMIGNLFRRLEIDDVKLPSEVSIKKLEVHSVESKRDKVTV